MSYFFTITVEQLFNYILSLNKNNFIQQNISMKKVLLYLSAFVPLYFLITVKILIDLVNCNLSWNFLNSFSLAFFVLLITFGIIGAKQAIEHKDTKTTKIQIISQKNITEQYFLGYFSLFVLFALTFELEKVSMFVVFVLIIFLIGIVYIKNNLFYINPLLNILGYNFYQIEYLDLSQSAKNFAIFFYNGTLSKKNKTYLAKLSHENFSMIIK